MKKLIVIASALALSACGGSEAEAPTEAEDTPMVENTVAFDQYGSAGTYGGTSEDGTPWSSQLNADGTFEDTENGEVIRTGTWTDNEAGQTCFIPEGETAQECYQMGDVQDDGTVQVTGPDGTTFTMNKTA